MVPSASDLTYLIEVAAVGNLSRAAERLGISQPSLTLAIHRIEKSVGTPVLVRHKRGVTLTIAGKQLVSQARQLLDQWDVIRAKTLASVNDVQGYYTIGCHSALAVHALPLFLGNLLKQYDKLEIKLHHDLSRIITEQVIQLKIDIGLVVNPTKHPDLVIKSLTEDKVRLWHNGTKHKILDLTSGHAVIYCNPSLIQTQAILKELKRRKINYGRLIYSNSVEVIAELTQHGCGIGILPGNATANRNLVSIAKSPYYTDEVCLLYRGEHRTVKAIQIITEQIKAAFLSN